MNLIKTIKKLKHVDGKELTRTVSVTLNNIKQDFESCPFAFFLCDFISTNICIQDKSSKTKKKRKEVQIYDISKIKQCF